jgi:cytochrome c5
VSPSFKLLLCGTLALPLCIACGVKKEETKTPETTPDAKIEATAPLVADLANGKTVYDTYCFACHMAGVAGAAAVTDKPRWDEIAAKPMATLHSHVISGFTGTYGTMPAKGTCMDCDQQALFDAIHFMMDAATVTPTP